MDVELMPPVSVVLIVDSSYFNSLLSKDIFHGLSGNHGQLHKLNRFFAGKPGSIFYRHLGVNDQMSAIAAGNMRLFRSNNFKIL